MSIGALVYIEEAMIAAEHAARAALLDAGVDLTGLVLNITFNTPGGGAKDGPDA